MKRVFVTTLLMSLAGPALAESITEKTGVNSLLGVAPSTEDFVREAATSDMFEIQSSELAAQKSTDSRIKSFAEHMIKDHTKTTADLKGLVASGKVKVEPPAQLDSSHQSELDKPKGLSGEAFAKQYRTDQRDGHQRPCRCSHAMRKAATMRTLRLGRDKRSPPSRAI